MSDENTDTGAESTVENTEVVNNGGDAEKTLTQAEVDRIVKERLARERNKYADYEDLKAKLSEYESAKEASKTDLERMQEELAALKAENEKSKLEAMKATVAAKFGLSEKQAKRLSGSTLEELEEDAEDLVESFSVKAVKNAGTGKPKENLVSGTSNDLKTPKKSADELAAEIFSKGRRAY